MSALRQPPSPSGVRTSRWRVAIALAVVVMGIALVIWWVLARRSAPAPTAGAASLSVTATTARQALWAKSAQASGVVAPWHILLKNSVARISHRAKSHESAISTGFEFQAALKTRCFWPYPRRWRVFQRNRQEAIIGAQSSGLSIASLDVAVGDVVRRGQRLARFDTATLRAEQAQLAAALTQAQAQALAAQAQATIAGLQCIEDLDFIALAAASHWGGSVGNFATYANVGGEWRWGYRLPDDLGTASLRPGGENMSPLRTSPAQHWNAHLFMAVDARWVLRDITLDGNTFKSSHSVDKRPVVVDVGFGVAANRGTWRFAFARYFRSREFEGQPDVPVYGTITVGKRF